MEEDYENEESLKVLTTKEIEDRIKKLEEDLKQ